MSWRVLFVIIVIALLGTFIYLKVQVLGDPNSHFNQTTRLSLGQYPLARTILGLHSVGDARIAYMEGTGPIAIVWLAPEDETIDSNVLQNFAALVSKYTGRQAEIISGGSLGDDTMELSNLKAFTVKAQNQAPSGTNGLDVFITDDYSPRPPVELSRTYEETGMVLSLNAHKNFIQNYPEHLDEYLLSSMLHEFGNQIGMQETATGSPDCIMNLHAGINGQPVEFQGYSEPQDFCPSEQQEINNIKLQLQNN